MKYLLIIVGLILFQVGLHLSADAALNSTGNFSAYKCSPYLVVSTAQAIDLIKKRNGDSEVSHFHEPTPKAMIQTKGHTSLNGIKLPRQGKLCILSIGVKDYKPSKKGYIFNNSVNDARNLADFFSDQYYKLPFADTVISRVILNEDATRENIIKAINEFVSMAHPEDYFIFNFTGFTISIPAGAEKASTWFVPYGLNNFLDTAEIVQKSISISTLKDLFQFLPAENQLFLTEAGNTPEFSQEFNRLLIEDNPVIASISSRNRIILFPTWAGFDAFFCKTERIESGPLCYYLMNLSEELNVFNLFESGSPRQDSLRKKTEYAIRKVEIECGNFELPYFTITYEKEIIENMNYFLNEVGIKSRGLKSADTRSAGKFNKINEKHALIIGTDVYKGSAQWQELSNPVFDATAVANELKNTYGYSVTLLTNPPIDTIYKHLIQYSKTLDSTDQFFLFIAGHGDFDDMLDDGLIICHDSRITPNDRARNTTIQFSKLSKLVNRMHPKQIMVVLDICFGGTFDEQVARGKSRSGNQYEELDGSSYLNAKLNLKTRLYISSGGKKEVPDGYRGKHSPFAYKMLEALRTGGGNLGMISSQAVYEFVKRLPSGPLMGSFGDDEPGSEFIMVPKIN
jgi:hypothetical protein